MSKKKLYKIAKLMAKASLKDGTVDAKLVRKVTASVASQKPYGLSKILKIYKNLISARLAKEELVIEAAALPPFSKSALLQKTGAKRVVVKINPQIVFGTKIKNGDWIWEETLNSKLEQIKKGI